MRVSDNARICVTLVATMLVIAMLGAVVARHLLERVLPPPLATVDLTAVLRRHQTDAAASIANARSADERQRLLRQTTTFGASLEQAIATVRQECRCILVLREAVVAGDVPDLTPRLAALIDTR